MKQTIFDVPIADKRTGLQPSGNVDGVFFQEWMAGRKKEENRFRKPVDVATVKNHTRWAKTSGAQMVLLNWETLPPVPSNDVPVSYRWDDAFALAQTIDLIRKGGISKVWIFGLRLWDLHAEYISPKELWSIYRQAGVELDGITFTMFSDQTALGRESQISQIRQIAPQLGVGAIHNGSSQFVRRAIHLYKIDEVLWYRLKK